MWQRGQAVAIRELVHGRPWLAIPVTVVEDTGDFLAVYLAEGTPMAFPEGDWPRGAHPWSLGSRRWEGHGVLQLHRPGDPYSVWAFWHGPERRFSGWYVNFQAPLERWEHGFDTRDQELDIWIEAGAPGWVWKDRDRFEELTRDGHFTRQEAAGVRAAADEVAGELDAGRRWWDERWAAWQPDPVWPIPELPEGWDVV